MDYYSQYLKRRIFRLRLIGVVSALAGIAYILFYYFGIVKQGWVCTLMLTYIMALNFLVNSTYQEIFSGVKISKLNLSIAIIFLLATVGLIVYYIVTGQLRI